MCPKGIYYRNQERANYKLQGISKWLMQYGDRKQSDLEQEVNGRYFVKMADGWGKMEKIYLPYYLS